MKKIFRLCVAIICCCMFVAFPISCNRLEDSGTSSGDGGSSLLPENYCSVTFIQEGEEPCVYLVEYGTVFSLENYPNPKEKVGYTVEWENIETTEIIENIEVRAIFTAKNYQIHYYLHKNQTSPYYTQTVTYDAEYSLLTTIDIEGNTLLGWKNKQNGERVTDGIWKTDGVLELVAVWKDSSEGSNWSPFT